MARRSNRRKTGKPSKVQPVEPKVTDDCGAAKPTPEMLARVDFEFGPVKTEMNVQIGAGYHRIPVFETLAKTSKGIRRDDLEALRFYRASFDRCQRSATKSCLDASGASGRWLGAGEPQILHASPALVEARRKLRFCEEVLHPYLSTMRAVVLDDKSFSEIAIERFGGRRQDWIVVKEPVLKDGRPVVLKEPVGKDGSPHPNARRAGIIGPLVRTMHRERIAPLSGRHREVIRQEFLAGMRQLTMRVQSIFGALDVEEVWVQPRDAGATIQRGPCAPNNLYRLWAAGAVIGAIMADLHRAHPDGLAFETPQLARTALDDAASSRPVNRLDQQELAA